MQTSETNLILIVDDTPTNLEVLSEALTDAGFEVAVATSGEIAIEQVEYDPPDLILLDVMMPGIDGFETCYRLKQNPLTKDIPVIFMTALSDTVDKVKGLALGAVDYITKPFQQAEVLARIQIHVNLRNLNLALEEKNIRLQQEIKERTIAEAALQQLTQELEQRVAQRTQELAQTLHNLQTTQVQLVQKEKLATLGQLVAGIAHEINNPVNFVHANIYYINKYTQSLLQLLQLYQNQFPQPTPEILAKAEEIDLQYLIEDLPKILSSIEVGTERICGIVKSLRSFSRHDEAEVKVVDIHEGIESTLMLLRNNLKPNSNHPEIQLVKKYSSLPKVECYPGKINQVFMNILSNAIDALTEMREKDRPDYGSPMIQIHTDIVGSDRIIIRITDNGPGIPENIQQRVFDPFFTTKPAGKGTGLGMSISDQIVTELHHGSLQCISNPGKGAEFVIEIPIQQPRVCRLSLFNQKLLTASVPSMLNI
ncbi:response regulator [Nostoc sp. FACHB-152]|uniref:hybrid sensor histidine kinase/response regulator n=1 Tax=unclassified Nostoc TaxID=2593658 RepID=UPI001683CCF4|nr:MULTISPECIES: response regulator [unclassified Nostoc]MBD2449317.1 response regulator [Nostoc sp. FACHB-152]MBD2470515.1 response regulator [Nostoc sp. FACHB-145]